MSQNPNVATCQPSFHSHHAPLGAFATFTLGLVSSPGGFGHALRGPARQNVYVGFRTGELQQWQLLPFFLPPRSIESTFTGEAATVPPPQNIQVLTPDDYQRTLGWASDTWRADRSRFGFSLLSPFDQVDEPNLTQSAETRFALAPLINGWIEYDNTEGEETVELIFGLGEPDLLFRPLHDTHPDLLGFALGTQFAYATLPGSHVESRQAFSVFEPKFKDHRGLLVICGESALVFRVPAGTKQRFPLVFAFYYQGTATTGITTQYAYTQLFRDLEDVVAHGLEQRERYESLALKRDIELSSTNLSEDQKFLIAQATHSYLGNTQALSSDYGLLWVVNEGEYRMMNTFDLTVDHLFFELIWFPWTIRNTLDLFVSRYSYTDEIQTSQGGSAPGGISFTHDMGVCNAFTPQGHSSYECNHLRGCFSHMTMEQLLNWVLCAVCYASHTGDTQWLGKHQATLRACAESLRRRDHVDPAQRDGILKHDTLRCGADGSEITTYDSLDVSLGQARNNLYLAVKTLGAWILLEHAFKTLGLPAEQSAAATTADMLAATLARRFDVETGTFPAVFESDNQSRIIPAVEGFAYPLFLGIESATDRNGRFGPLLAQLRQHLTAILKPGICIDAVTGSWKMSSTSTNTWFSKIALAQHVVRRMFPEALSKEAAQADKIHAQWQRLPGCGAYAMCDQIRSDSGITCGSRYYPRGVTTILWMRE